MATCLEICWGACCQDLDEFQLTKDEYDRLCLLGASLWKTWEPGVYKLRGKCPYLVGNICSVRGTRLRPWICGIHPFMGPGCRSRRYHRPDLVRVYLPGELDEEIGLQRQAAFLLARVTGKI